MKPSISTFIISLLVWLPTNTIFGQGVPLTTKGDLVTYTTDERGNRIPDFSYCGYMHADVDIPDVPVVVRVTPQEGDNAAHIQRAIDYVATLPLDATGFRGAVLLEPGTYAIDQALRLSASGIILRGAQRDSTILLKRGYDRGAIVYVEGVNDYRATDTLSVTSAYVPVGSTTIEVAGGSSTSTQVIASRQAGTSRQVGASQKAGTLLQAGTRVTIHRSSTAEWIDLMDCKSYGGGVNALGWKAGDVDLNWDRTVVAVDGDQVTLDAPIPLALNRDEGPCTLLVYDWPGRISHVGVENLTLIAETYPSRPFDEDHAWTGISLDQVEHAWVRRICFRHLAGSAVVAQYGASCVTVEDCASTEPVSEVGGMRRRTFHTLGQHILFQRCYAEQGINDFAAGWAAPGPNAFVQCEAKNALGFSGSTGALSPGLLFDVVNIEGQDIILGNLGQDKNGAGWNTANSLVWQCTASVITCDSPTADARNYAYGCWAQFKGKGPWGQSNNHVYPRSIYAAQLTERIARGIEDGDANDDANGETKAGAAAVAAVAGDVSTAKAVAARCRVLPRSTKATSSPPVEMAMRLAQEAYEPLLTLEKWIADAPFTADVTADKVKLIDEIKLKQPKAKKGTIAPQKKAYAVTDGYLVADGALLAGSRHKVRWWNGNIRPSYLPKGGMHITRFVPDMEGLGLTDRIDTVVATMKRNHTLVLDHNYGLWYDRRRDDHERIRRHDGDVWPPFFEQAFARSGEGRAWDGLSQYDLTRPNAWYWSRLQEFAGKAETEGLLLFHQDYFQHNIIEAGAHWVDCPWRTANNVNATGFPEPVNFAGDKRIFVADMFYDVTHPTRRELHRNYIHQCLSALADYGNVVHLVSEEYTGPLHFVEFWLDCILEWEKETGRHPIIALSTTRDVQDAILADPVRSAAIDLIDIHYWHYRQGDTPYTPEGGRNLAPRQHARLVKVGRMGYAEAYRAVLEYRLSYPDKAVTLSAQNYMDHGWAVLMAGGSCPVLPVTDEAFLAAIPQMRPVATTEDLVSLADGTLPPCQLLQGADGVVAYFDGQEGEEQSSVSLTLSPGNYALHYIDPTTGEVSLLKKRVKLPEKYILEVSRRGAYWLQRLN